MGRKRTNNKARKSTSEEGYESSDSIRSDDTIQHDNYNNNDLVQSFKRQKLNFETDETSYELSDYEKMDNSNELNLENKVLIRILATKEEANTLLKDNNKILNMIRRTYPSSVIFLPQNSQEGSEVIFGVLEKFSEPQTEAIPTIGEYLYNGKSLKENFFNKIKIRFLLPYYIEDSLNKFMLKYYKNYIDGNLIKYKVFDFNLPRSNERILIYHGTCFSLIYLIFGIRKILNAHTNYPTVYYKLSPSYIFNIKEIDEIADKYFQTTVEEDLRKEFWARYFEFLEEKSKFLPYFSSSFISKIYSSSKTEKKILNKQLKVTNSGEKGKNNEEKLYTPKIIYRLLATKEEANYILRDDGAIIKRILRNRQGVIVVYESMPGANEVIFGVGDDFDENADFCERVVVHLCRIISNVTPFLNQPSSSKKQSDIFKFHKPPYQLRLLIQEDKADRIDLATGGKYNNAEKFTSTKIELNSKETFPGSNECLLRVEGDDATIKDFLRLNIVVMRIKERLRPLVQYITNPVYIVNPKCFEPIVVNCD